MLFYDRGKDYGEEVRDFWNQNVTKYRRRTIIIAVIMLVLGVLCFIFPVKSILLMEILASILIFIIGIFQIVSYFSTPSYLRLGGSLIGGILNLLLGFLLLTSSSEAMLYTFAFIFAIEMMICGIEELAGASRMRFFAAGRSTTWITVSGILNIICAVILIIMPQASVAISWIVAFYLLSGGITLLIAAIDAKKLP